MIIFQIIFFIYLQFYINQISSDRLRQNIKLHGMTLQIPDHILRLHISKLQIRIQHSSWQATRSSNTFPANRSLVRLNSCIRSHLYSHVSIIAVPSIVNLPCQFTAGICYNAWMRDIYPRFFSVIQHPIITVPPNKYESSAGLPDRTGNKMHYGIYKLKYSILCDTRMKESRFVLIKGVYHIIDPCATGLTNKYKRFFVICCQVAYQVRI